MEVTVKSAQEIAKRMLEIENQIVWSKEDQGEWVSLVWVLGLNDRQPPWEDDNNE